MIGYGNIGKEVAVRALAFGMNVIAHDPMWLNPSIDDIGGKVKFLSN